MIRKLAEKIALNFWNLKAPFYRFFRKVPIVSGIFQKERNNITLLIKQLNFVPINILDVGSGTGATLDLLPESQSIYCIDSCFNMAKILQIKNNSIFSIQGNAIHLPFKKQQFQFVSAIGLAEYVQNKSWLLEEMYACLTDKGFLCITIAPPNLLNTFRNFLGSRLYTISSKKWEEIIHQSGFEIVNQADSLLQRQYLLKKN